MWRNKSEVGAVYGDVSPSMTTIRYWFNEFKHGQTSVFDEERLGCPAAGYRGNRWKGPQHDSNESARSSRSCRRVVWNGIRHKLNMRKMSVRWVPRLLTVDKKRIADTAVNVEAVSVDPLLYARGQATVKTGLFSGICSKEGKDDPIGRKGHGHDFLEFQGNNPHGLFAERKNNHEAILQWIIGPIQYKIWRRHGLIWLRKGAVWPW